MTAVTDLTFLGVVLLGGIICAIIASKIRIPHILLFLGFGILLNTIRIDGSPIISFPLEFIASLSVFAIAMIVFESASKLKIREFDAFALKSISLTFAFLAINFVVTTLVAIYVLGFGLFTALIFSSLLASTAPEVVMSVMKAKSKIVELLEIESIINTPLVVLLPFVILNFQQTVGTITVEHLIQQALPFLQQIITGVGTGVIVGLLVLKLMKRYYARNISAIAVVTAVVLTYALAEQLGGNSILGVTTLGLFFGTFWIKQKEELLGFSETLSYLLLITVFVLLGIIINFQQPYVFYFKALLIFAVVLFIRFLSVSMTLGNEFKTKEKIFATLNSPKGLGTAVVVLVLSTTTDGSLVLMLDTTMMVLLYSIVLSSITVFFSKNIIGKK